MSNDIIGYNNAVFAHNSNIVTLDWYPFTLDLYEWEDLYYTLNEDGEYEHIELTDLDLLVKAIDKNYDIWQIDTAKLDTRWYLDDVGDKEFSSSIFQKNELYVVAHGNIPTECISKIEPTIELIDFSGDSYRYVGHQLLLP